MTVVRILLSALVFTIACGVVLSTTDVGTLLHQAGRLSPATMSFISACIVASTLLATWRLQRIAHDTGHRLTFREALASVSSGALGGAVFFQIAGQLIARGALLQRHGVPFAATVAMTAYERAVAGLVSLVLAAMGAMVIFGRIWIDVETGGGQLLKLAVGLLAATAAGAAVGYGRLAARAIAPFLTRSSVLRLAQSAALTLAVQLAMMLAYVVAATALSPATPVSALAAAAALVMFAASVPVSLAGWGIREMSAIAALGAIGVAMGDALLVAVIIGATSLVVLAGLALVSARAWVAAPRVVANDGQGVRLDFAAGLAWGVPLAVATFVLFQVHVPVASGMLNVNLADPLAILGGVMFILSLNRLPTWRLPGLNAALAVATCALSASLFIGAASFGWTSWAVVNKWLGWFVLLAYGATGALIVQRAETDGLRLLLLTYAAAAAAIAFLDVSLVAVRAAGLVIPHTILEQRIGGFAQNANAFAFQMLMALIVIGVLDVSERLRTLVVALAVAGIWFSSSRAGWLGLAAVLVATMHFRQGSFRGIAAGVCAAGAVALVVWALPSPTGASPAVSLFPEAKSIDDHWRSMVGAWHLFLDHPLLGAGLGAFSSREVTHDGLPLVIHSTSLWLLAEAGLIGFLAFAFPAVGALVIEWRRPDLSGRVIVLVLLAFAVMSLVHELLYQRTMWLILGAAIALLPPPKHPDAD